jgi:uncharacterized damage-inducible protein DinB
MQLAKELKKLFERDLDKLSNELSLYSEEEDLWIVNGEINNSAGNLTLHLCGNLKHFIGATLSDSRYERDRPFEFAGKVSRRELEKEVKETKVILNQYLGKVEQIEFNGKYPLKPFGYEMTVSEFILHLYGHFNYHLGQINYHRRILII